MEVIYTEACVPRAEELFLGRRIGFCSQTYITLPSVESRVLQRGTILRFQNVPNINF